MPNFQTMASNFKMKYRTYGAFCDFRNSTGFDLGTILKIPRITLEYYMPAQHT